MLTTARELGYPARTVTPALTRFSRIYVIQVGGNLDAGTVTLATHDGGTITVALPAEFAYRKAPPARLAALLAAVEADYPPQSLTAGLTECLASVLDVCAHARSRNRTVPLEAVEEALSVPLRPFLDAWTPRPPTTNHHTHKGGTLMSRIPPSTPAPPPDDHVTAVCAATYYADLRGQDAFIFLVAETNTRFTVYASHPDRYEVAQSYALIIAAPDAVPVPLGVDDLEFLRHCLATTAQRWREAITETDTGAAHPPPGRASEPGYLNVEPTPAGYRVAGRLFRDELTRVEQLDALLGEVLTATHTRGEGS